MTKQSFKIKRLGIFNVNEVVNNWFNDQFGVKMPFIKKKFFLFFYIIFLFIIVSNVGGLLPFTETVTVYLILNLFFSFTIQFGLMIYSLFVYKWDYLRGFLPQGVPPVVALLLLPVEFISFISRILSLGIRLFANMFAGHCVMIIICMIIVLAFEGLGLAASPVFFPIFCTVFVLICLLEIAVALLQAYVFLSLVLIYLNVHLEFH
jgi:F-type H+-transporting ATPase subunit a